MNKFFLAAVVLCGVLSCPLHGALARDTPMDPAVQLMYAIVSAIDSQHAFKLRDALEQLNICASDPNFNVNYQRKETGSTLPMLLLMLEHEYSTSDPSDVAVIKSWCNICIQRLFDHPRFDPNITNVKEERVLTFAVLDGRVYDVKKLLSKDAHVGFMVEKDSAGNMMTEILICSLARACPLARLLDYVEIWAALIASGLRYNPKEFGKETQEIFRHNPTLYNILDIVQKNPFIVCDALTPLRYMGRLGDRVAMWKLVYEKLASALHQTYKHGRSISIEQDVDEEKDDDDDVVKQPARKKQKPNDSMDENEH